QSQPRETAGGRKAAAVIAQMLQLGEPVVIGLAALPMRPQIHAAFPAGSIDQSAIVLALLSISAGIRPDFGGQPGSILQSVVRLGETDAAVLHAGHQAAFVVLAAAQRAGGIHEGIAALKWATVQTQLPAFGAHWHAFTDQVVMRPGLVGLMEVNGDPAELALAVDLVRGRARVDQLLGALAVAFLDYE